jgi:enamine deaminase RidA (YjgF/YER057c/UK114 family)
MRAQLGQAFDNLEAVLQAAGFGLADLVRLNYYTTDAAQLLRNWDLIVSRLGAGGARVGSTLLGVAQLAFPELLVEIEGTAVK